MSVFYFKIKRVIIEAVVAQVIIYSNMWKSEFVISLLVWIRLVEMTGIEPVSEITSAIGFYKLSLLLDFAVVNPTDRAN